MGRARCVQGLHKALYKVCRLIASGQHPSLAIQTRSNPHCHLLRQKKYPDPFIIRLRHSETLGFLTLRCKPINKVRCVQVIAIHYRHAPPPTFAKRSCIIRLYTIAATKSTSKLRGGSGGHWVSGPASSSTRAWMRGWLSLWQSIIQGKGGATAVRIVC